MAKKDDVNKYGNPPERDDKWIWGPGEIQVLGQCVKCRHKHLGRNTCDAFPAGIPDPIQFGDFDHTAEYPGDKGIRHELVEELLGRA